MIRKKLEAARRIVATMLVATLVLGGNTQFACDKVYAKQLKIQTDVPDLKEAIISELDEDFLVGGSICAGDLADENGMALVKKHFNAITFGNELKPDSMFNYSNDKCPGTVETTLHGEKLIVPVTNFDRPEKMLKYFYEWNKENPDSQIKIRGHVLTWHSQTPEWFFHEDYDASKPYVTPEVMTKRHEWYIKTVLEHFVGPDSIYKDMFYGWDVVNEAVSDNRGTYRNAEENSSWWAVYGSQEYIINAFRFANMYAPESLELYYNDYGDASPKKAEGIAQLLTDVKNAEGTRIDGMGMQGHYQTADNSPTISDFKDAARKYGAIVDKVQLTELDFQASSDYDGTDATYEQENTKLGHRYKAFYDAIKELRAEGVNFSGMTVWGVIDTTSWLQHASFVGGGAKGNRKQVPLLFDGKYQVKQAYWAFVDPAQLKYPIKSFEILETSAFDNDEECFKLSEKLELKGKESKAKVLTAWATEGLKVKVAVTDKSEDATDEIKVYWEQNGAVKSTSVLRSDAVKTKDGYEAVVTIAAEDITLGSMAKFGMDFVVVDGEDVFAFNDLSMTQDSRTDYYAKVTLKTCMVIPNGTVTVDGELEDIWYSTTEVPLNINLGAKASGTARLLWDENYLYVYFNVKDDVLNADSQNDYEKDSVEVFIDEKNQKATTFQDDDKQYRIDYLNNHSFNGVKCIEENILSATKITDDGYVVEAAFKWTHLKPGYNKELGIELQINDATASGTRCGTVSWFDATGTGYENPSVYGPAVLGHAREINKEQNTAVIAENAADTGDNDVSWFQKIINKLKNLFK